MEKKKKVTRRKKKLPQRSTFYWKEDLVLRVKLFPRPKFTGLPWRLYYFGGNDF